MPSPYPTAGLRPKTLHLDLVIVIFSMGLQVALLILVLFVNLQKHSYFEVELLKFFASFLIFFTLGGFFKVYTTMPVLRGLTSCMMEGVEAMLFLMQFRTPLQKRSVERVAMSAPAKRAMHCT